MMNNSSAQIAINDARQEFKKISSMMKRLKKATSPTRKYLTFYSLIKASGVIEYSYKTILADFHSGASTQAVSFIDSNIRDGSKNPTIENICGYLKQFDTTWLTSFKHDLKVHPDSSRIQSSLKSLCQNRNCFAHGKPSTASFNDILQYFEDSVIIISILDSIVV